LPVLLTVVHGAGHRRSRLAGWEKDPRLRADRLPRPRFGDDVLMEAVPGLRRAVVHEYRRVLRPPWEIPTALVTNGALMVAAWFLLPPRAHAFLFSLNGPLAFPVILASWMLADTPATNAMGSNPALALAVL
jgi:hypothetical protein